MNTFCSKEYLYHTQCSRPQRGVSCFSVMTQHSADLDCVWRVMAHTQKPDFIVRRNGRVHLNRQGRQFSRLLAAEVCASAVVMLNTPSSEVVKGIGYPLHSPLSSSLPLPCVNVCHHVSTGLYLALPSRVFLNAGAGDWKHALYLLCTQNGIHRPNGPPALWNTILCVLYGANKLVKVNLEFQKRPLRIRYCNRSAVSVAFP
jgi:hypothetical protein